MSQNLGWSAACALLLASGCAQQSSLLQLEGQVSVDGKPANGATVLYFPQSGAGDVAAGSADAEGRYSLVTNLEPGIAPGKYKVAVTWPDPAKANAKSSVMGDVKDPPDLLRGKYSDPNRSPLTAEIGPSAAELPPLELSTR